MRKLSIGLATILFATTSAHAATIINGSFELGTPQPASGTFNTLGAGSTAITGWTVVSGSIDWINGYWQAQDGTHSVDLAGNEPGAIEQSFVTTPGVLYTVDYWLSGNPDGGDIAKEGLVAAINGASQIASSTITGIKGSSRGDMQYLLNTFQFTATGALTTLRFSSSPFEGPYGASLDSVSIRGQNAPTPVPEPTTWAMLMIGFGVVGVSMRRRRTVRRQLS
ncbi:choice-of-anchor C domain-containing protein [Sphingomonas laterariae]|uniref:Choice-of-anchor C domain-containing protein n=1 Tax=Edaphosphingomonas laterariae TaxID=861865 RepID=A0A239EHK9_9SPHN|nr:choice-of-anchor C family protein [Sphingomonas laterariae]SNS44116.1 choice-of-anchor C domain-containing protein [Sphingomonas laterariae]